MHFRSHCLQRTIKFHMKKTEIRTSLCCKISSSLLFLSIINLQYSQCLSSLYLFGEIWRTLIWSTIFYIVYLSKIWRLYDMCYLKIEHDITSNLDWISHWRFRLSKYMWRIEVFLLLVSLDTIMIELLLSMFFLIDSFSHSTYLDYLQRLSHKFSSLHVTLLRK